MRLYLLIFVLLTAGGFTRVSAQTTQPAAPPDAWNTTVQQLGAALNSDNDACKPLLSDECDVRSFNAGTSQLADLFAHTGGATLLMSKAYVSPAGSVAADVAAAIAGSQAPDEVKKALVAPDGEPTNKANLTADQWMRRALNAPPGEPVGLLLFFVAEPTRPESPQSQILFVLVRGKVVKQDQNRYVVSQIVYGDPEQAAESAR